MRVRTYHRHTVQRNSPALHGLLGLHTIFSLLYTAPVWFTYLGIRWQRSSVTDTQRTWMIAVLVVWFCAEVVRLYLGRRANKQTVFGELIAFLVMTLVPQLLLVCALFVLLPERNDLEFGVCVTQILLLALECVATILLLMRVTRNNVVDFYVSLGSPYC
ncbi:putative membrane protein [Novymonas esmeraldas]|uniref:Membrane protein n=1 Tax=Novymonas esmeraldas TaxID=1808958 RepID=A0AAW0F292_9TRYP